MSKIDGGSQKQFLIEELWRKIQTKDLFVGMAQMEWEYDEERRPGQPPFRDYT